MNYFRLAIRLLEQVQALANHEACSQAWRFVLPLEVIAIVLLLDLIRLIL